MEWVMPLRQVLSHHAFLFRRVVAEATGFVVLRMGKTSFIPSMLQGPLLRAGRHFLPRYSQSHLALGQWALGRGDTLNALASAQRAIATSTRVEEVPVLPSIAPRFLRVLGFSTGHREQLQNAAKLGIDAALSADNTELREVCERIQSAFFSADQEAEHAETQDNNDVHEATDPISRFRAQPEVPDHLVKAAEDRRDTGDIHGAYRLLQKWRWTHPTSSSVWHLSHLMALATDNQKDADFCMERCLLIHPERARLAVGYLLQKEVSPDPSLQAKISLENDRSLTPSETTSIDVIPPPGTSGHVIVLAPYGVGVCPVSRVHRFTDGEALKIQIEAHRPHRLNMEKPWELNVIVVSEDGFSETHLPVSVTDPEPGEIVAIITNDHELHDFRAWTQPEEADLLLVDKARLCEQIAEERSASWGHMIEASAIRLLGWLGEAHHDATWTKVAQRYQNHLIDCVDRGHDLGLHIHAFYDPDGERFTHRYDPDSGDLQAAPIHLFSSAGRRPFWHRAYPHVGSWDDPASKRGSLLRALGRVESLGRLGDPGFRVSLFRAGGYDIGKTASEKRASLFAVQNAGILADSNVVKPRFYKNFSRKTLYLCSSDDPRSAAPELTEGWLPELIPEYNVEGDFLANAEILNRYVDERILHFSPRGRIRSGVHVITSMSHTKFINFRRGLESDNLDKGYGDWETIDAHLAHLNRRGVKVVRIRDAIDAVVHDITPEPVLVRGDEEITPGAPTDSHVEIRIPLQVLGKGIPLDKGLPFLGVVHPPAWAAPHLESVEVFCGDQLLAHRTTPGFSPLRFPLSGDQPFELRLRVPIEWGVIAEHSGDDTVVLRSAQPFKRAHIRLGDRLYRDVRFNQTPEGSTAVVSSL